MKKKAPKKKAFQTAIDDSVLEARANTKKLRAHAALEREIVKLSKLLNRRVNERDASLFNLAQSLVARDGRHELVPKAAAADARS